MKQIKTIRFRLDSSELFDSAVNSALREGWELKERRVLLPLSQSEGTTFYSMLYAALEKDTKKAEE